MKAGRKSLPPATKAINSKNSHRKAQRKFDAKNKILRK
jgi:hypothetical protein